MESEQTLPIASTRDPDEAQRWTLLMEASGVRYTMSPTEEGFELSVDPGRAEEAREWLKEELLEHRRLTAKDLEEQRIETALRREWQHYRFHTPSAVVYAVLLLTGYQTTAWVEHHARIDGAAVRAGEVWRLFSALMLHADIAHLLSNLVIGALVVGTAAGFLGPGVGFLAMLTAGAAGNGLSVWMRGEGEPYFSLGASTAVFGALGLLSGVLSLKRRSLPRSTALMPAVVGLMLLGYFGTGGWRTDVVAHLCGFLAGFGLGALLGLREDVFDRVAQRVAAALAAGALAWAWSQVG